MIWILIGKMFISQSFTENMDVINGKISISSPLKTKSLHLLSKFRGQIFNGLGEK